MSFHLVSKREMKPIAEVNIIGLTFSLSMVCLQRLHFNGILEAFIVVRLQNMEDTKSNICG